MLIFFPGFLGQMSDFDFLLDIDTPLDVAVAYSMGARVVLRIVIDGAKFDRLVIISAGLNLEEGRDERRARDEAWASRFETDPWDELMRDWNAQPVLRGHVVEREERDDYDRRELAYELRHFSPGNAKPLAPELHKIKVPVLWIAGERDRQYVDVARRAVALLPKGELWICPGAGHRVLWEQPQLVADRVRAFVSI